MYHVITKTNKPRPPWRSPRGYDTGTEVKNRRGDVWRVRRVRVDYYGGICVDWVYVGNFSSPPFRRG